MEKRLEQYLDTIDRHLKPLPTSERIDIVKEIKSFIFEMEKDGLTTDQILDRLGNPKDLAREYLGDFISKDNGFNWNKCLTIIAFYSLTGLSGLFVIPVFAIIAPVFVFCGILIPILGTIKLLGYFMSFDVPFVSFQLGSMTLHPMIGFIFSVVTGIALYLLGRGAWKLLLQYIHGVSKKKRDLSI